MAYSITNEGFSPLLNSNYSQLGGNGADCSQLPENQWLTQDEWIVEEKAKKILKNLKPRYGTKINQFLNQTKYFISNTPHVKVIDHPFYDDFLMIDSGHVKNFIKHFSPADVCTRKKTPREIAEILKPANPENARFYNAEQVFSRQCYYPDNKELDARNANADLGLQYTIDKVLRGSIITYDVNGEEIPSFIIISHGHSIAGLAALSKMTRTTKTGEVQYLFDTSIYMPQGGWPIDATRLRIAGERGQLWTQVIQKNKNAYENAGIKSAGGMAIALNGHRCDLNGEVEIKSYPPVEISPELRKGRAYIDPEKMLGSPEEFIVELKKRGLNKVVIINELPVNDPEKPNTYSIDMLKTSKMLGKPVLGSPPEADLYHYMVKLKDLGIKVVVVSGEQRMMDAFYKQRTLKANVEEMVLKHLTAQKNSQ